MAQKYAHFDLTTASRFGPPIIDYPLVSEGDPFFKEVSIPMCVYQENYTPSLIGTTATIDSFGSLYCAGDYNFRSGGSTRVLQYEQRWSNRPFDSTSGSISGSAGGINYEYESYGYTYPGIYKNLVSWNGRNPITRTVMSRIEKKYYVVGVDVTTPDDIPLVQEQEYYYAGTSNTRNISSAEFYINEGQIAVSPSVPSLLTWQGWVQEALSGSATQWRIPVESSTIRKLNGAVYVRETRYVKAY